MESTPPSTFLSLPAEILINVLDKLDLKSVISSTQTCHKIKQIFEDSSRLQYAAELELAGMKDNPYCAMPIAERLDRLRRREDAWRELQPDFLATLPVPRAPSSIYDVTPNVYLLGVAVAPDIPLTRGIQSMRLPSEMGDTTTPFLELQMTKPIVDFGTSIEEHDLLAVVTMASAPDTESMFALEVALIRHSTGMMHDEAQKPLLLLGGVNDIPSISIEVSGENLAVIVVNHRELDTPTMFHLFNWRTGTRKGAVRQMHNAGLAFLREDILFNPDTDANTFNLYHIPFSTPGVDDKDLEMQRILSLSLPELSENHRIVTLQCRCDPSPTSGDAYPRYSSHKRPFSNDPAHAVMIVEMRVRDLASGRELPDAFVMFVHRRKLLELLPEGWERNLKASQTREEASMDVEGEDAGAGQEGAPQPPPSLSPSSEVDDADAASVPGAYPTSSMDADAPTESDDTAPSTSAPGPSIPGAYPTPDLDEHDSSSEAVKRTPWDSWGPANTRWLDADKFSSVYITSTAGQRFVSISKSARVEASKLRVIDFNGYHVRKAAQALGKGIWKGSRIVGVEVPRVQQESQTADPNAEVVEEEADDDEEGAEGTDEDEDEAREEQDRGLMGCKGAFKQDPLESRLPYLEMKTKTKHNYNAVLVDEQRILGIRNISGEEWNVVREVEIIHYG
ncbi:hypothetical protein DFP72DRAFT_922511 [Ephemerocybe angulata]|uniref:F-box domain-containing protein n=1 Tax=Ephemerocybe angulata TaxID=980116 RepID=A0A8H6HGP3_9AGAR|nr:hypothetical protein DFP72DRAFT_922511 [Tulosesus angulatus]